MKRTLKLILGPLIIIATLFGFGWYVSRNPQIIDQLAATSPLVITWIVILYMLSFFALAFSTALIVQLYNKRISYSENFLLTMYSSLVNFFGPTQSGPGVRAVYLKLKHGIKIRQFIFGTLLYYAWYGVLSGLMLLAPIVSWWQATLVAAVLAAGSYMVIRLFMQKNSEATIAQVALPRFLQLFGMLGVVVAAQIACIAAVYYMELRSLDSSVDIISAISYTGAANFALFVAITPGAIGIREAFLVFSQQIHGISNDLIVAASVLDRAAYFLILGIMFVIVLVSHAGKRFKTIQTEKANDA